jgi:hypothetical protein
MTGLHLHAHGVREALWPVRRRRGPVASAPARAADTLLVQLEVAVALGHKDELLAIPADETRQRVAQHAQVRGSHMTRHARAWRSTKLVHAGHKTQLGQGARVLKAPLKLMLWPSVKRSSLERCFLSSTTEVAYMSKPYWLRAKVA